MPGTKTGLFTGEVKISYEREADIIEVFCAILPFAF